MYKYKNKNTGAVIETRSRLIGGNWIPYKTAEVKTDAADAETETDINDAAETDEEESAAAEEVAPVQQDKEEKKNPEKPAGGAVIKPRKGK